MASGPFIPAPKGSSYRSTLDVRAMSIPARIEEALRRAIPKLPAEAAELVKALITPRALAEMAATLAIWAGSHFIGIGELADLILLLSTYVMLGSTALHAAKQLFAFASDIIRAHTSNDLDRAAEHFANAVALAGVTAVSALLLRKAGAKAQQLPEGAAVRTGAVAAETAVETPYSRAVKTLDFQILKKLITEAWQEPGKWPVKIFKLRPNQSVGEAVLVDGYITTEQSVAGASLRELEKRLGLAPGYLGDAAAVVRLDRLPTSPEFDLRFYNSIHGGGIKPPDPRYPLGPGYPQWELLQKLPGHILKVVSR